MDIGYVQEIKDKYFLPERLNRSQTEFMDFVMGFRNDIMTLYGQNSKKILTKDIDSAIESDLQSIASNLQSSIEKMHPFNIVRYMKFVANLKEEVEDACFMEMYMFDDGMDELERQNIQDFSDSVTLYLTNVASYCLNKDNTLTKHAELLTKSVIDRVKSDFLKAPLSYIQTSLSSKDVYCLLLNTLNEVEENTNAYNEYYQQHCEGCGRDDCFLTYCSSLGDREKKFEKIGASQKLVNVLISKIQNKEVSEYEVSTVLKSYKDTENFELIKACIYHKTPGLIDERINVNYSDLFNRTVILSLFKEITNKQLPENINLKDKQDVLSFITSVFITFENAGGDQIYNEYRDKASSASECVNSSMYNHDTVDVERLFNEFVQKQKEKENDIRKPGEPGEGE